MSWPAPRNLATDPAVTPQAITRHKLNVEEYARVVEILGREPTWTELGVFSVMWSEHCSYKSSRIHLRTLPTSGPQVLQGPGENAGVVDIGDGWAVAFKMESHNHPSFLSPHQGAATGVGGILRDVFTMGARPIALLDLLRFGRPSETKMRRLVEGVVEGIAGYGNCVGVPTVAGDVAFDESYDGNILVNAMAIGVLRGDRIFRGIAAGPGNPVLYVGSRTGRDGIHGATMASDSFEAGKAGPRPTVQVGDPYAEKLLIEACLELMDEDAIVAIQDMGAAGLTSSSVEMAGRGGTGLLLQVDQVPRREPGMSPYECLLSESQERMLVIAARGKEAVVERIFRKWDLEVAIIGHVTDDGIWRVVDGDTVVAAIPVEALCDAAPLYDRPRSPPEDREERLSLPDPVPKLAPGPTLRALLAHPDVAEKRWVWRQYDHMVQTNTVVRPGAADAAVVRVPGTQKALALKADCNSTHVWLDPFWGTAGVVAEAARNVACTGARPLAVTDCLNFGNPQRPEVMWSFERSVAGLGEALRQLSVPVVSGNVSLYNETGDRSIHPTPALGIVGLLERWDRAIGCGAPRDGEIVLIGTPRPTFGGSLWLRVVHGERRGAPPRPEWDEERALLAVLPAAVDRGLLLAAHDLSDGGLAVALAELCFAARGGEGRGAVIRLPISADAAAHSLALFGETHGCALAVVESANVDELILLAQDHRCGVRRLGHLGGDRVVIHDATPVPALDESLSELREVWAGGFCAALGFAPLPVRP